MIFFRTRSFSIDSTDCRTARRPNRIGRCHHRSFGPSPACHAADGKPALSATTTAAKQTATERHNTPPGCCMHAYRCMCLVRAAPAPREGTGAAQTDVCRCTTVPHIATPLAATDRSTNMGLHRATRLPDVLRQLQPVVAGGREHVRHLRSRQGAAAVDACTRARLLDRDARQPIMGVHRPMSSDSRNKIPRRG